MEGGERAGCRTRSSSREIKMTLRTLLRVLASTEDAIFLRHARLVEV